MMTLKGNLKAKIKIDRLFKKIESTIRNVSGRRKIDRKLTEELLEMTAFELREIRDLRLYVSPLKGDILEILVLDNELPIYHSTVEDVVLRKAPYWQEMISIGNIIKILSDKDVISTKGLDSLIRIHAKAISGLDLTYSTDDLARLVEDARRGVEQESVAKIQESFEFFFELLDFQAVSVENQSLDLQLFAGTGSNGDTRKIYEHLILFNKTNFSIGLKRGVVSLQNADDIEWIDHYAHGEQPADAEGMDVFMALSDLARKGARKIDYT